MVQKILLSVVISFSVFLVSGCSSGDDAKDISFVHNPDDPLVINADLTVINKTVTTDGVTYEKVTIPAPWFKTNFYFKNNSGDKITIQTIKYYVTRAGGDQNAVTTYTIDPGLLPVNTDADNNNDQYYLVELNAGAEFDSTAQVGGKDPPQWYVQGLPKATNVKMALSYIVKAEAIGWYGDHLNPTKNLKKRIYFRASEN